ncbi:hypothetical protein VJ918_04725 [Adlercreutzia sp. R21]|uniref:DUF4190 domain-containing protein n=1 Tax=Adlercreutzia wanghongyangiae TaxID=3111451 RepID=A0ABU6IHJ7_9ACTN|nr:hypothetical protein [Adlercreutzia sp. R21]MEC4175907.1 hypothetical protein [Adlercreutzia sp. R7]MEC4184109.1 hypothetical protein [Adlercreutzia sp. R21]
MEHRTPPDDSGSTQPGNSLPAPPENQGPQPPQGDARDQLDLMDLNSARTLSTVATIAGPVSFIIGGVALSSVALVCAILALVKVRRVLSRPEGPHRNFATVVRQTAIMGVVISSIALALNIIGLVTMIPILMEAMQTGDYSAILGEGAADLQGGISGSPDGSGNGNPWG